LHTAIELEIFVRWELIMFKKGALYGLLSALIVTTATTSGNAASQKLGQEKGVFCKIMETLSTSNPVPGENPEKTKSEAKANKLLKSVYAEVKNLQLSAEIVHRTAAENVVATVEKNGNRFLFQALIDNSNHLPENFLLSTLQEIHDYKIGLTPGASRFVLKMLECRFESVRLRAEDLAKSIGMALPDKTKKSNPLTKEKTTETPPDPIFVSLAKTIQHAFDRNTDNKEKNRKGREQLLPLYSKSPEIFFDGLSQIIPDVSDQLAKEVVREIHLVTYDSMILPKYVKKVLIRITNSNIGYTVRENATDILKRFDYDKNFSERSSGSSSFGYKSDYNSFGYKPDYKPESYAEWKARQEKEDKEKAQREEREKQERLRYAKEAKSFFEADTVQAQSARDALFYRWLEKLNDGSHVAMLLLGNAKSPVDPKLAEDYAEFAKKLMKGGYRVVYDADSTYAPVLAHVVGKTGIGISGGRPAVQAENILILSNPYLRMAAFGKAKKVIASPDSVNGRGLLFEKKVDYIFDPEGKYHSGHAHWADGEAGRYYKIGLPSYSKIDVIKSPDYANSWKATYFSKSEPPGEISVDLDQMLPLFDSYTLKNFRRFGDDLRQSMKSLAAVPGGAVVFGSGSLEKEFVDLVYQSTRALASHGVTIATGGSGGFMEVANAAAFDAGAQSIGIPLGYGSSIGSEKTVARDKQSLTITADGYETRIPLLLHNRQLYVFVPGGRGTMKELAATLVKMAAELDSPSRLVFVSDKYYRNLASWLAYSDLPEEINKKISLISSPEEMEKLVQYLEQNPQVDQSTLRTEDRPQPRNSNNEFKIPPEPLYEPYIMFNSLTSDDSKKWQSSSHTSQSTASEKATSIDGTEGAPAGAYGHKKRHKENDAGVLANIGNALKEAFVEPFKDPSPKKKKKKDGGP